jgi:glutathione S-transferase
MLKLYYAPGACSLSPHIALREAEIPFELVRVDFAAGRRTEDGLDYRSINPKGYVPALRLDNGQILTEGAVMVQYIADSKPEAGLAPAPGSFARVRLQEWLHYIATELHKGMGPLALRDLPEDYKASVLKRVGARFDFVAEHVAGRPFLFGDRFSIVDGYMVYALRAWKRHNAQQLSATLDGYYTGLLERPTVKAAFAAEGIH